MHNLFSGLFASWIAGVLPLKPQAMQASNDLQVLPPCSRSCTYGHCSLISEPWFTRVLNLERKRSDRSRNPFLLVLLDVEGVGESNGGQDRLVHDVLSALMTFTRDTDVTGWYQTNSTLGIIFTELGNRKDLNVSIDSIVSKTISALDERLGREKSGRIDVSCHVYPDDWTIKKPGGRVDSNLYPDLKRHSRTKWLHSVGKRMLDIIGSLAALVLLLPVLITIAAVVKLTSKGPVLFRQDRVGQFGERFMFLKFRSMYVSNDDQIHQKYVKELIAGEIRAPQNGVYKIQDDPRITPAGRFLRKTSLDELPQFWNVLLGQMSLVGPRPPLPYEVDVYDTWHRRRVLEAKPGITGLWQVNGRSRTCFDDMVRLDLRYARSSSFWLDLKILLKTPGAVLAGSGAY
jgi:lipopolysaccharide/colanic/teichoic acid biosynthesis glycosyltransferase